MPVLEKIAHYQNRRDEVPNQELAKELAVTENRDGIQEIAANLWNKDKNIQSDCLKVLYEIGYLKPELVAEYVGDFIKLLRNKNNRLVWGAMIALSTIAALQPREIFENLESVIRVMQTGSVITVDNGVKTLAVVASENSEYNHRIFPYLINHLTTCRPKEVPQHAEKMVVAVNPGNKDQFLSILNERKDVLTIAQQARIKKILKLVEKIDS